MNSKLSLFENLDVYEESLLRSAFLLGFNRKGKQSDQYRRAILAIIIYGINDGGYDASKITSVFNQRFKLNESEQDIQRQINTLISDDYIRVTPDGKYVENDQNKKGKRFFDALESKTTALIERIVAKVNAKFVHLSERQISIIKSNTKNALSAFFQMNALAMFDIQEKMSPNSIEYVVEAATQGLDKRIGEYLISVLAYTIEDPKEDKDVLEQWAKAVIAMRSTNLDPLLRNFRQQQIAHKRFVLDTDVLLNLLCKNARFSHSYRMMIDHLVSTGASILIPEFVIDEVKSHANVARFRFASDGKQHLEFTDEMLEGPKSNVFIEDYVKTIRNEPMKKGMHFDTYIENICSKDSDYVIKENIKKLLGRNDESWRYVIPDNVLDEEKATELKEKIKYKAMVTPKGEGMPSLQIEQYAINDTRLYLTIRNENIDIEEKGILGYQCYLLTRSVRTIGAATEIGLYDKHVVCHPQSLISILEEIGRIEDVEIINLFDNPFLAYTADLIWDQIDPLIQAGAQIGFSDLIQLRVKYDLKINEILTEDMAERQKLAEKYHREGLLFAREWHELFSETEKTKEELKDIREQKVKTEHRNEKLEKENKKLRGQHHHDQQIISALTKGRKGKNNKKGGKMNIYKIINKKK